MKHFLIVLSILFLTLPVFSQTTDTSRVTLNIGIGGALALSHYGSAQPDIPIATLEKRMPVQPCYSFFIEYKFRYKLSVEAGILKNPQANKYSFTHTAFNSSARHRGLIASTPIHWGTFLKYSCSLDKHYRYSFSPAIGAFYSPNIDAFQSDGGGYRKMDSNFALVQSHPYSTQKDNFSIVGKAGIKRYIGKPGYLQLEMYYLHGFVDQNIMEVNYNVNGETSGKTIITNGSAFGATLGLGLPLDRLIGKILPVNQ